ncbi:probable E3 ubiquitin-protein ligase MID2 [Lineus longissimus]|uniref:probable E3 ubiquitin-protein ligase MID2 n=1 Tax=Lineus longissimus TaxID=88925 RepID=UPI00315DB142
MKMASRKTEFTSTCLICFETRALKIVGRCNHNFCTECLSTVFDSRESGSEVFLCPTCQKDCPRPSDGVKGLLDFTGIAVDQESETITVLDSPEQTEGLEPSTTSVEVKESAPDNVVIAKCQICLHRKKDAQAVVMCIDCGHFYYCQDCSDVHAKNKATRDHSVAALRPDRQDEAAKCKLHSTDLMSYCQNCNTTVCTVCVMLDHGDHDIENLRDTIQSKVGQVSAMLEKEESKLKELEILKQELTALEVEAQTVDQQKSLIKKIEDHAQTCIDKTITWKEQRKAQVATDFKVVRDIPECLKTVSEAIEKIREPLNRASRLLSQTEHHPDYLEKLVSRQQDLESIGRVDVGDEVEGREYKAKLSELRRKYILFIPAMDFKCGKLGPSNAFPGSRFSFSLPEAQATGGAALPVQPPRHIVFTHSEPYFSPIMPLPELVVQTTGEEEETVLYKNDRARLYRFSEGEWKERGTGPVKLLKNETNGKVRFLMRRERVLKICANHFLHGGMTLTPMKASQNAYMWCAQDFSEVQLKNEQFALRFRTEEMATEFRDNFLKAVEHAESSGKERET